jgi:hypothetical protein
MRPRLVRTILTRRWLPGREWIKGVTAARSLHGAPETQRCLGPTAGVALPSGRGPILFESERGRRH